MTSCTLSTEAAKVFKCPWNVARISKWPPTICEYVIVKQVNLQRAQVFLSQLLSECLKYVDKPLMYLSIP